MRTQTLLASLVLGSAMLAGCEERTNRNQPGDEDYTSPPPRQTTPSQPGGSVGRDTNNGTTTGAPGQTGTQAVTRAQTLISEVNQHILNRDFDQAEEKLDQLESMKSQLPPSVQTQIESLRKSFDAQKAGAGAGTTPPSSPATPPPTTPDE